MLGGQRAKSSDDHHRRGRRPNNVRTTLAHPATYISRMFSVVGSAIRFAIEAVASPSSSIGAKLVRVMVLTSGAALILASVTLITIDFFTTRDHMIRDLKTLSQVVIDNSAASLMFDNPTAARETLNALRVQPDIQIACLYSVDWALFAEYSAPQGTKERCSQTAPALGERSEDGIYTLTQAVVFDGEREGYFLVRLKLSELGSQFVASSLAVGLVALACLLIAFILAAVFQRRLTAPLLELVGLAKTVTLNNDYTVRATLQSDDEIGELMNAFNGMLTTVQSGSQALQEANSATELKNAELQKEMENRVSAEHERDHAIEGMSEGFALWSSDDCLVMCNSVFQEMFADVSDTLFEGTHFREFLRAAVNRDLYDTDGLSAEEFIELELKRHRNARKPFERCLGEDRWLRISKRRTETGGVVGIYTDVSEKRKTDNTIRELALSDPLTGLANRNRFHTNLAREVDVARKEDSKVALLIIDLDRFKPVNDEYGHATGDQILRLVAERLIHVTRSADTVARLGGDEFAIIMPDLDHDATAVELAHRVIDNVSRSFEVDGFAVRIGVSVGISVFPELATDVDELIRTADLAMYQAKAEGRETFRIYDEELHASLRAQTRIEEELRRAIDANELTLFYQPQLSLDHGRLIGVEALVRWRHPELGLLLPDKFMRVAETSGLILRIDEWVLREACRQNKRWQAAGLPAFPIAVNVSAHQFKSDNLVAVVADVLEETEIDPDCLEIEITEHMVMDDVEEATRRLSRLHDLGVRLAVDDFGTGYSSLSYLKKFPVWRLKIDRTFVRDIAVDTDDAAIVDAIIRLGRSLRLKVLAEGVETAEQVAALQRLGCKEAQGYLYSKPIPADALAEWVANHLIMRHRDEMREAVETLS